MSKRLDNVWLADTNILLNVILNDLFIDTACIGYYETLMPWHLAAATCRNMKAELISFLDKSIISLIYNATKKNKSPGTHTKLNAWTSARATSHSGGKQ